LNFGVLVFVEGGTGEPIEKPLEQGENQQQIQPTYDIRLESKPGHIGNGWRRVLSPLHHTCSYTMLVALLRVGQEPVNPPGVLPYMGLIGLCTPQRVF